ncbi:MAG: translation elongation factor Ts [bacterium]|nr:translation elongation factor Ts [bacterium]MDE0351938.1 translation elongation factor Ts [bacterium]MXZ69801.1 elongation factor Ts [Acidimicrobiia bacterium]MYB44005.1 elongation factor Ts [Acidimicrobiia bacterium]MYC86276.1 elongation factor Ts [Acidimicrobiia bacterium]
MPQFTAKDVQALRKATGVGMMDAKKALVECDGDMDRAKDLLREKGLADAKKRAGRDANEGTVGFYVHQPSGYPTVGVIVELASETDFVAKSDRFQKMAHDVAMHIAAAQPKWVRTEDVPGELVDREKELIAREALASGKPERIVERIVEGRINSFYKDNVLYEQEYIRTDQYEGKVGDMVTELAASMGENIGVRRFARLAVGEQDT